MTRLRVDPGDPEPAHLAEAAASIRAGAIVGYPTDTLYGLAADPRNARSIDRLFEVKRRPTERAVPLIAGDAAAARAAGQWSPLAETLASGFWPGPLALLVVAAADLTAGVHGGTGRVAVRVPACLLACRLAALAGGLITATSANVSGEPPTADPADVARLESTGLDVLLDGGPSPGGPPSTIVDATGSVPALVRPGAVPWGRVLEFLDIARFRRG
jgi:L-threonylcarbamoyladenylate synthase